MRSGHRNEDQPGAGTTRLPPWLHGPLVLALLAGCWALVYGAGGTRTAFPHVFYIPIVIAALPFGLRGGMATAFAATLLCGPAMPLDVAAGESQPVVNWLIRGGFFVAVGSLAGMSTASLRRSFEEGLTQQLQDELELAAPARDRVVEPGWELRIRQALDRHSFHPVFQPIYSLQDGRLVAVEALTRFDGPPQRSPDVWFGHAVRTGLGVELELAAVKSALEVSADSLPADVALTFNASPSLLADDRLMHLLQWHGQRNLIAEVTEHVIVEDYRELKEALWGLRARGIRLAVDDAGAGFASLRHIVRLQPEYIKLDPSLTQNLHNDPVRRPLADCLLQFAHRIGSSIVVEGIETTTDLLTWEEMGAHAGQGYLLGRPGPLPVAGVSPHLTGYRDGDATWDAVGSARGR